MVALNLHQIKMHRGDTLGSLTSSRMAHPILPARHLCAYNDAQQHKERYQNNARDFAASPALASPPTLGLAAEGFASFRH